LNPSNFGYLYLIVAGSLIIPILEYLLKKRNNYSDSDLRQVKNYIRTIMGASLAATFIIWLAFLLSGHKEPFFFYSSDYSDIYVIMAQAPVGILYLMGLYFMWFTKRLEDMLRLKMFLNLSYKPILIKLFLTTCIIGMSFLVITGKVQY